LAPERDRQERARHREYRNKNKAKVDAIAADWKKRNWAKRVKQNHKGYLRYQARIEAKETGEDVYDIYERWDILSAHDVRNDRRQP
jgi:hypothetical protein